ncbi:MAG: glycosyltransferase family 2 protein [Pseudomonadota bacterium]
MLLERSDTDLECDEAVVASTPNVQSKPSITAIILTYNEEVHIERCLRNAFQVADRVIVIDSFSIDGTVLLARKHGAEIYQRRFKHQADQLKWALDTIPIATEWIIRLDCDEFLEAPAIAEIKDRLPHLDRSVNAVSFRRKFIFMDQWIKRGGYYPITLTRLWRRGKANVSQQWMDERIVVESGRTVCFQRGDIVDHNLKGIGDWTAKHNRYATRHMIDVVNRSQHVWPSQCGTDNRNSDRRRRLKYGLFFRAPLYARTLAYFFYRYLVRLGFLDGKVGLVFHTLHGLWFFLLIDAKLDEARRFIAREGFDAFRARLHASEGIEI